MDEADPAPIKTYSLEEVAAMVLPAEWADGVLWLKRRLAAGEVGGYRLNRNVWRMTRADVEELIEQRRNRRVKPAPELAQPNDEADHPQSARPVPVDLLSALSPRSRRRLRPI
jgi:hypothetical protein